MGPFFVWLDSSGWVVDVVVVGTFTAIALVLARLERK